MKDRKNFSGVWGGGNPFVKGFPPPPLFQNPEGSTLFLSNFGLVRGNNFNFNYLVELMQDNFEKSQNHVPDHHQQIQVRSLVEYYYKLKPVCNVYKDVQTHDEHCENEAVQFQI